jgi:hypothetical protein
MNYQSNTADLSDDETGRYQHQQKLSKAVDTTIIIYSQHRVWMG